MFGGVSFHCHDVRQIQDNTFIELYEFYNPYGGWSGGAMVLGKLPLPGRPSNFTNSRARVYCACSGCGWGLLEHIYSHLSSLLFLPLFGGRSDID